MGYETYTDSPYRAFKAAVAADLIGKEGYAVEQVAGAETIQLYTSGVCIGFLKERLEGSDHWNVALIGKGGTVKVVAGGAIASPGFVKPQSGGKVIAAAAALACGIKISPVANSADGDVIEIISGYVTAP
ncbi:MAG TPA: hypothetical protein PKA41_07930 [Verrucomicrobiota bacterium]|nr:hypothetical protein [Verrucomicrobiota bacterium]